MHIHEQKPAPPFIRLAVAPVSAPPWRFWPVAAVLFAIACFGNERYALIWQELPTAVQGHFAASPATWIAFKESVFLAALLALAAPLAGPLWRAWRAQVTDSDFRHALFVFAGLLLLVFTTRPSSLGIDYQAISTAPFAQDTWGLHRRLLEVALAYYLHLNGALYILLHAALVLGFLMLLRAGLRLQGLEPSFLEFLSLAGSAFVVHQFQYPGYPDVLVLILAWCFLLTEAGAHGRLVLATLALLAHEALAVAVVGPLLLYLPPRERWGLAALAWLYGVFWAANFGFNPLAGWGLQVNYLGHSGPALLLARPWVVLAGIAVAFKLLWLPLLVYLGQRWRQEGLRAVGPAAAPLLAALVLCVVSYDTSRMAGMGFVTLLIALVALWHRLGRWPRLALFVLNLAIPSVYISPVVDHPWGVAWSQGGYSAYNGFVSGSTLLRP